MMRILCLVGVCGLMACGSTDSDSWEKCDGPPCHTDADSRWDIFADGGDVDGDNLDFIGPPDPYICLTIAGSTKCSSHVSDSTSPRWSDLLFEDIAASSFLGQSLGVRYMDKDTGTLLDTNDDICSGTVTIGADNLAEGGVRFSCERGTATFTFHFIR